MEGYPFSPRQIRCRHIVSLTNRRLFHPRGSQTSFQATTKESFCDSNRSAADDVRGNGRCAQLETGAQTRQPDKSPVQKTSDNSESRKVTQTWQIVLLPEISKGETYTLKSNEPKRSQPLHSSEVTREQTAELHIQTRHPKHNRPTPSQPENASVTDTPICKQGTYQGIVGVKTKETISVRSALYKIKALSGRSSGNVHIQVTKHPAEYQ